MTNPKDYPIPNESEATIAAKVEFGRQALARAAAAKPVMLSTELVDSSGQALPPAPVIEPQMVHAGWYGVDLDGTLAYYDTFKGGDAIGEPIAPMLAKVMEHLDNGDEIRIFTARVSPAAVVAGAEISGIPPEQELHKVVTAIYNWTIKNVGRPLNITCQKDFHMIGCYDDRCIQIVPNKGIRADGKPL